jgi:hypothetical protein
VAERKTWFYLTHSCKTLIPYYNVLHDLQEKKKAQAIPTFVGFPAPMFGEVRRMVSL